MSEGSGCATIILLLILFALWGISDSLDTIHHDLTSPGSKPSVETTQIGSMAQPREPDKRQNNPLEPSN